MRIVTYNVNGIRAALNKGLIEWIKSVNPDVICFQEVKANLDQIDSTVFSNLGFQIYWHSAEKKGYSGVAILTKFKPNHVEYGCGMDVYDREGRVLRADFDTFSLMSAYFPSGSSGDIRQAFKMQFLSDFMPYAQELKKGIPNLIIAGDINICHRAIDIHNPKSNARSSGFLPEEREWMENFVQSGFVDTFRSLNNQPHHYTWWSLRFGSRAKNLGWRIDYQMITEQMKDRLKSSVILPNAYHSDHCPVLIEID
ncbi:MAG: exodeoxyribonuclease III [Bacteroidota bacterium]